MGQPVAPLLDCGSPVKRARAPLPALGVAPAVVRDIAAFARARGGRAPRARGRLELVRARTDRPAALQARAPVPAALFDGEEDDEEDARGAADVVLVFASPDGVCWELGCWMGVRDGMAVFQLVLDTLAETVGACQIAALRVRDGLHRVQCVQDGLDMLRGMREGGVVVPRGAFVHPVTNDRIDIVLPGSARRFIS